MSQATEADLQAFLDQQHAELGDAVLRLKRVVTDEMAGRLHSGMVLVVGARKLEEQMLGHIADMTSTARAWEGAHLPVDLVIGRVTAHLRQCAAEYLTAENASPLPEVNVRSGAAWQRLLSLVEVSSAKVESRIRQFELGVQTAPSVGGANYNIVHAGTVMGGVQQAGGDAVQHNSVTLVAEDIGRSLDQLVDALDRQGDDKLRAAVEPDVQTLKIQLAKPTPSPAIIQETGRSLRAIVEGGIGGALGGAATPGLLHALTVFCASMGLG